MTGNADLIAPIESEIDAARDGLIELCEDLVSAVSINPPGNTADMAGIVLNYLRSAGVPAERIALDDEAPNVVARATGARTGRHVVFNAHMDTMEPGDEAAWNTPPYRLSQRGERLHGLGIGNMKGALAGMCLATALINRHRGALTGRVSLTAVSDEILFGDRGAVHLLANQPDLRGDFLISGEGPGFMNLAVAEKGLLWLDVEASGGGGHSSGALCGRTAVMNLACFLAELDPINDLYATLPPELAGVSGGDGNLGFRVSLNAGTIAAGTVRSQIATRATAQLDIRLPPGIAAGEIEGRVRALAATYPDVRITNAKSWDANWTALHDRLVTVVAGAADAVRGAPPQLVVRLPGSDARRWRALNVPAICYGPQALLSAGVDEYAVAQDIIDCAKIYARSALSLMEP